MSPARFNDEQVADCNLQRHLAASQRFARQLYIRELLKANGGISPDATRRASERWGVSSRQIYRDILIVRASEYYRL